MMANAIDEKERNRIHFGKRVTAIGQRSDGPGIEISVNSESRVCSHVISTLPLPVLRTIDMKDAGMNILQKNALRQLQYGPPVKIAILFKEP
ncbi:hypothetical protein BKA82DRAFT_1003023 [Pisolithus tinctorius]|uniref:Amine oxidase domain-containing protein n=1 Tax=Pisolithus tinctorius Marx 270 TaxID=870435 RepID=A0A0C3P2V0_PISTI|nr:hypothetical protein BKA82DRAFT_1003023 [Pisolithus tinctorius]KIO01629.1 hypothetical protein M404DRAFT_1003023 [Pisolithus tinctorius Marx 270]